MITLRCIKLHVAFQFQVIRQKQGIWNQGSLGKIYAGTVGRSCWGLVLRHEQYAVQCVVLLQYFKYHDSWSLFSHMDGRYLQGTSILMKIVKKGVNVFVDKGVDNFVVSK